MNRKLLRQDAEPSYPAARALRQQRKPVPPETTNAETFYYRKQMENRTRMVIVLKDGEELRGTIEWYDRASLKVHRNGEPNILLMKDAIKYMFKEGDEGTEDE